jgi:transposase
VTTRHIRKLERELQRKEKALAEAAALLVLKKTIQDHLLDEDSDTGDPSGK